MNENASQQVVGNVIQELTAGRPFVFVVMPFKERWQLFEELRRLVLDEIGIACIRADDVLAAGYDLLDKIHLLVERSELVIAEISEPNANVFYEIGYAAGNRKSVLLLAEAGREIPTDLRGRELIYYESSRNGMTVFRTVFREQIRSRLGSRVAFLRDMLQGQILEPVYIVASPKYPGDDSRIRGQVYDRRTYGDNLGVVGLLSAFGLILGEGSRVELISAQYCEPDLVQKDCNLYLIGSKKVNPVAGDVLERVQNGLYPKWYLGRIPHSKEVGDYRVHLYKISKDGKPTKINGKSERRGPDQGIIHVEDYGIIVKTPHPEHPGRVVIIMAGVHSLGTGGACIAATRSIFIGIIRRALPNEVDLSDLHRPIWALIRARASDDLLLDEDGVEVVEAGTFDV